MRFHQTILGLAVGGSSIHTDTLRSKQVVSGTAQKFLVKVTLEHMRKAPSIHEETPKGIGDGGAGKVFKAITPCLAAELINKHETVADATRTDTITKANINSNAMENGGGTGKRGTRGSTFLIDNIADGNRRFKVLGQMDAIGHLGEDGVIAKFAIAKVLVKVVGRETASGGTK
jgi:hypothetical protein